MTTSDEFNTLLKKLKKFSEDNSKILEGWNNLIKEAKEEAFGASCLKDYLNECEPSYCSFRYSGECTFFNKLHKIDAIIGLK